MTRSSRGFALTLCVVVSSLTATLVFTASAGAQTTGVTQDFSASGGGNLFGPFLDRSGLFRNATDNPAVVNRNNPFFTNVGGNGQACVTCHQPSQGFSVVEPFIKFKFAITQGRDPLFRLNDTADRPDADISTLSKRRAAFALFLDLGVVRIGKTLPNPATREFEIVSQNTPRFGQLPSTTDPQAPGVAAISVFRRPLATTNTRYDSAVLFDGRQNIHNLRTQVQAAARTLLLDPTVSNDEADATARFMTGVFTAQEFDFRAGSLTARGAEGGVETLRDLITSGQAPCVPMTDPAQAGTFVPSITPVAPGCTDPIQPFDIFKAWQNLPQASEFRSGRMSVARGEALFNSHPLSAPGAGTFTCTGCHVTTNIGNFPFIDPVNTNPTPLFVRLGLDSPDFLEHIAARDARMNTFVRRTADLPVYAITLDTTPPPECGLAELPNLATGQPMPATLQRSTDPGRAMVTGLCADLGAVKPPILRGLAMRGPFFHNGAAETLEDVVEFYDVIFNGRMSRQQREDLVAYLRAL